MMYNTFVCLMFSFCFVNTRISHNKIFLIRKADDNNDYNNERAFKISEPLALTDLNAY